MTIKIQHLPGVRYRIDTGVLQLGRDWPGYFMRGDYALPISGAITRMFNGKAEESGILLLEHVQRLTSFAADVAFTHTDPAHAERLAAEARAAGDTYLQRLQAEGKI